MMNKGFNVTFERWIESGFYAHEPFYRGIVIGDVSLSDALRELAAPPHWPCATEADEWPMRAPALLSLPLLERTHPRTSRGWRPRGPLLACTSARDVCQ